MDENWEELHDESFFYKNKKFDLNVLKEKKNGPEDMVVVKLYKFCKNTHFITLYCKFRI